MISRIYYNGKLIYTIVHPRSVLSPKEAKQDTKDKLTVAVSEN